MITTKAIYDIGLSNWGWSKTSLENRKIEAQKINSISFAMEGEGMLG